MVVEEVVLPACHLDESASPVFDLTGVDGEVEGELEGFYSVSYTHLTLPTTPYV